MVRYIHYKLMHVREAPPLPDLERSWWKLLRFPVLSIALMGAAILIYLRHGSWGAVDESLFLWVARNQGSVWLFALGAFLSVRSLVEVRRQATTVINDREVLQITLWGQRRIAWDELRRIGGSSTWLLLYSDDTQIDIYLPQYEHSLDVAEYVVARWRQASGVGRADDLRL